MSTGQEDSTTNVLGRRGQRVINWLNDYVARWFTIVLCLAALGLGALAGLLVSHSLDASWVEALGTWVGGIGTLAAVLVAYHIYKSEAYERAVQRATDALRETEAADESATRDERAARLVTARLGWRSGQYVGEKAGVRFMRADSLSITVNNRSPQVAYNVEAEYGGTPGSHAVHFDQVPPAGRKHQDWVVRDGELEVPEDQAALAVQAEAHVRLSFDMFDSTWTREPDGTLVRRELTAR